MNVQKIDNTPNFGIKYVKPRKWNSNVLDTLMKSNLVKQIDNKYPNAQVKYLSGYSGMYPNTRHSFSNLYFILNGKQSCLSIGARYDAELTERIQSASLDNIEKQISNQVSRQKEAEKIYQAAEELNRINKSK